MQWGLLAVPDREEVLAVANCIYYVMLGAQRLLHGSEILPNRYRLSVSQYLLPRSRCPSRSFIYSIVEHRAKAWWCGSYWLVDPVIGLVVGVTSWAGPFDLPTALYLPASVDDSGGGPKRLNHGTGAQQLPGPSLRCAIPGCEPLGKPDWEMARRRCWRMSTG